MAKSNKLNTKEGSKFKCIGSYFKIEFLTVGPIK